MIYTILIILLSIGADQLTKYLAVQHLAGNASYPFIENILEVLLEKSGKHEEEIKKIEHDPENEE